MMVTFQTILTSFLDFVYPPSCVACGRPLETGARHICASCWSEVVLARDHPHLAAEARAKIGPDVDGVVSAFVFQKTGPLQSLIHGLKYQNADRIGVWLGERVAEELKGMMPPVDVIAPVPLHRAKERERGYNQAEMIARGLASRLGSRMEPRLLKRIRHTPSQTKLSIERRKENVSEAFRVDPALSREVCGATVIVVDDVITTGATIGACARTLRASGAAVVLAGSVALADHHA